MTLISNDIGYGGGKTFAVSAKRAAGGFIVYRYTGRAWVKVGNYGAMKVAVGHRGRPFTCDNKNRWAYHTGSKWVISRTIRCRDVGANPSSSAFSRVWRISNKACGGGNYKVYTNIDSRFSKWLGYKMCAKRIAVDSNNRPWIVTAAGNVYWYTGKSGKWARVKTPVAASDVACYRYDCAMIGKNRAIYKYVRYWRDRSASKRVRYFWKRTTGTAKLGGIAMRTHGKPMVINAANRYKIMTQI